MSVPEESFEEDLERVMRELSPEKRINMALEIAKERVKVRDWDAVILWANVACNRARFLIREERGTEGGAR
jgi:hypothetical protein